MDTDVVRAGSRVAATRAKLIRAAVALTASELLEVSDRQLVVKLGSNRSTMSRYFRSRGDLVVAVVAELDRRGSSVDPELRARARRHSEELNQDGDLPTGLLDKLVEIGRAVDENARIERTVAVFNEYIGSGKQHAIATICCYASYHFLLCTQVERVDAAEQARTFAELGIAHVPSGRSFHALHAQLYRIAAAAEHRLAREACAELTVRSTDLERVIAERKVLARMSGIGRFKNSEATLLDGMSRPVLAAAARYHAQRAIAISEARPDMEIEATCEFARVLVTQVSDQDGNPPSLEILIPFLTRWCAAQVAYPDAFADLPELETYTEWQDILVDSLATHAKGEAASRTFSTMFALAASFPDRPAKVAVSPDDLTAILTYGTVGQLLVGNYLSRLARKFQGEPEDSDDVVTPDVVAAAQSTGPLEQLLTLDEGKLVKAASVYYEEAVARSLVGGSSSVLVELARKGFESIGNRGSLEPWPLLNGEGVDMKVITRLILTVLTRELPSPEQAQELLRHIKPVVAMLDSIANYNVVADLADNPTENGRSELIALSELSFH